MRSGRRAFFGLTGVFLFVLSLQVMSRSTQPLVPVLEGIMETLVRGSPSALGSGWIFSYVFLNGSSVAALSLALLSSGLLTAVETFMAIAGSRIGAAFIVVFIGLVEYIRGKNMDMRDSCSIGILSFIITYLTYFPAVIVGYLILDRFGWSFVAVNQVNGVFSSVMVVFEPIVAAVTSLLPPFAAFIMSFLGLFVSLEVFDKAFSGISSSTFENRYLRFVLMHPGISFVMGAVVTLVTTSVSISIGLIVPLYNKGYIKRSEVIPYIMGSNITTLVDTIFAAVVLETAVGINVVLILAGTVSVVTLVYLAMYDKFFWMVKTLFDKTVSDRRFLAFFVASLLLFPVLLLLV